MEADRDWIDFLEGLHSSLLLGGLLLTFFRLNLQVLFNVAVCKSICSCLLLLKSLLLFLFLQLSAYFFKEHLLLYLLLVKLLVVEVGLGPGLFEALLLDRKRTRVSNLYWVVGDKRLEVLLLSAHLLYLRHDSFNPDRYVPLFKLCLHLFHPFVDICLVAD